MSGLVEKLIEENLQTKNPVLDLASCQLNLVTQGLEKLNQCTHLQKLDLKDNQLTNIDFLPRLNNLHHLDLSNNPSIDNYSFLTSLKQLKHLYLIHNSIKEAAFLQSLTQLQNLELSHNELEDISFLKHLYQLMELRLDFNRIQNIATLVNLPKLQVLELCDNKIVDFTVLEHLDNLQILDVSQNPIKSLAGLANLSQLRSLDISHNEIQDISILESLVNLEEFYLSSTNLIAPPIWLAHLQNKGGKLGDYTQLPELPNIQKIWQLMRTRNQTNLRLAQQLATGQGWTREEFEMYKNLLKN